MREKSETVRAFARREGLSLREARRRLYAVSEFYREWLLDGNELRLRRIGRVWFQFDAHKRRRLVRVKWERAFKAAARERLQGFSWEKGMAEERDPWHRYTD